MGLFLPICAPFYCKCSNKIVEGGQASKTEPKKLIMKYAVGMEGSIMDIHLNTNQNKLLLPHEYIWNKRRDILAEINPLIKQYFGSIAKLYFFFNLLMQKLNENKTYEYSPLQIRSEPQEFHPQDQNVTENDIYWLK